jgi:hypothetical protein
MESSHLFVQDSNIYLTRAGVPGFLQYLAIDLKRLNGNSGGDEPSRLRLGSISPQMFSSTLDDVILFSRLDNTCALFGNETYTRFQPDNLTTVKFVFDLAKHNDGEVDRHSLMH